MENSVNRVRSHYDEVALAPSATLEYRDTTPILYLRNFNNWVKSICINKYLDRIRRENRNGSSIYVLDFCCGKGGDQNKWMHNDDIRHVTFIDLSEASIEACEKRYDQLRRRRYRLYRADFHVADCTIDLSHGLLHNRKYDLNSCQFAFHYAFESFDQAQCFLKNVSCSLVPGGFCIATLPNAYEIVRRANQAYSKISNDDTSDCVEFGNSFYHIQFSKPNFQVRTSSKDDDSSAHSTTTFLNFPLFGARYEFHLEDVVNCPEYLVYPPLLIELARKYDLIPVTPCPVSFAEFAQEALYKSSGHRQDPLDLLRKMRALRTIAIQTGSKIDDVELDSHVKHKIRTDTACQQSQSLGTLSQEEWDVITLYSVFVFQKIQSTYLFLLKSDLIMGFVDYHRFSG